MQTAHFGPNEAKTLYSPTGFDRNYWAAVRVSRGLSRCGTQIMLPEKVELPIDRPVMIAANHSSLFDLVAALVILGNYGVTARIAVNERFFANPVGGGVLRGIGCIALSRNNREEAERLLVDALLDNQACAMMPEGKIVRPNDQVAGVGQGRPGVSRIARGAGASVVPVGIANSDSAWTPGRPFPKVANRRARVVIKFGAPIEFVDDDHISNANRLMSCISELVLAARSEQPLR